MKKIIQFSLLSIVFISCSKEKIADKDLDFVKTVHFNDNDIRFYDKVFYKSYGNPKSGTDFAELKIEYPEIINSEASSDSINQFILNYLLNLPFNEDRNTSFDEIADSLISSYMDVQKDFDDYHTGWFIHASSSVSGVYNNILSITSEETIYTGGANTFYNLTYTNFNLLDGKQITLKNIVNDDNFETLLQIGENLFIELEDIQTNQTFEDAGFWFENMKFSLNDNFAITDSGLVFFYNLYEIAPRSKGTTQLFIPKEKLTLLTNIY